MRINRFLLPAVAGALVAGCTAQVEVETDNSADIAAINAVRDMEVSSLMAGDMTMPYATDGVIVMPPNEPMVVGREAAMAWGQAFVNAVTIEGVSYDQTEITVSGDLAVEHYTSSLTMRMEGSEEAMTEELKGVHVYRKQADGTWKMTLDVWNMDAPMEGM
jgi:ketosteroid isomerase-like protein